MANPKPSQHSTPPAGSLEGLPQADSYADHPRRRELLTKVEGMLRRYYPSEEDPYRLYEAEISKHLTPESVLLDAGCGRTAPTLTMFAKRVSRAIGVDLVDFSQELEGGGLTLLQNGLESIPLPDATVDVIISRSVMEHLEEPLQVYREFERLLRPGGKVVFITPNRWSYPIVAARMIPNRFHALLVSFAEGRPREDTFPTYHRSNSFRAIRRLARDARLEVAGLRYLATFPNYLMFHPLAFRAGVGIERLFRNVKALNGLQHWILAVLSKPR
ncbi:MAG: class I SAM-dependent methyltransferase [Bryobacteraceae bacterium]|nr:class I SAM-dependent methyltransferase [Bryobacteraceae bacterium]